MKFIREHLGWFIAGLVLASSLAWGAATHFDRLVLGSSNYGTDPNPTADVTFQYDEYISNATDGQLTWSGHWIPSANGTQDLGSSSYKLRRGYFKADLMVGSYYVPAARDSAETDSLLIQYGKMTVATNPDTIDFTTEGLSDYSAAPTLLSLVPVQTRTDTVVIVYPTSVATDKVIFCACYSTADTTVWGVLSGTTVHYALIGPR